MLTSSVLPDELQAVWLEFMTVFLDWKFSFRQLLIFSSTICFSNILTK